MTSGGAGGINLTTLWVNVAPSMAGFSQQVAKGGSEAAHAFGEAFHKGFEVSMEGALKSWGASVEAAVKGVEGLLGDMFSGKSVRPPELGDLAPYFQGVEGMIASVSEKFVGMIPLVGPVFAKVTGELSESLQEVTGLAGEVANVLQEIGTQWQEVGREIAGATGATEEKLENYLNVTQQILASGDIVHLEDVASAIGVIGDRVANINNEQLREFTTLVAESEELIGKVNVSKLTGALSEWGIEADEVSEKYQGLINIVQESKMPMDTLTNQLIQLGPVLKDFGLNLDQTATFLGLLNRQQIDPSRFAYTFQRAARDMTKNGQEIKGSLTSILQEADNLIAAGNKVGARNLLQTLFGPYGAEKMLDVVQVQGQGLLQLFGDINKSISDSPEKTKEIVEATSTLGDQMEAIRNRVTADFREMGVGLADEMRDAGMNLSRWFEENKGEIIGFGEDIFNGMMSATRVLTNLTADGLSIIAPFAQIIKELIGDVGQAVVGIMATVSKFISNVPNSGLFAPLKLLGFDNATKDSFRDMGDQLASVIPALDDLKKYNLDDTMRKWAAAGHHFADDTLPKIRDQVRGAVDPVKEFSLATEDLRQHMEEVPGDKTIQFKGQGIPEMEAGLRKAGIAFDKDATGMVTKIHAANEKVKDDFESWYKEVTGHELKVPIVLTKDGKEVHDTHDAVEPGEPVEVPVHPNLGGTPTVAPKTPEMLQQPGVPNPASMSAGGAVPLIQNADGTWTSPNAAWAALIKRESHGDATVTQHGYVDRNTGGNEAEGLFQIALSTWRAHGGTEFAASPKLATPQQQAIVAARILHANPSGSDWGAGMAGRENAAELLAGLGGAAPTVTVPTTVGPGATVPGAAPGFGAVPLQAGPGGSVQIVLPTGPMQLTLPPGLTPPAGGLPPASQTPVPVTITPSPGGGQPALSPGSTLVPLDQVPGWQGSQPHLSSTPALPGPGRGASDKLRVSYRGGEAMEVTRKQWDEQLSKLPGWAMVEGGGPPAGTPAGADEPVPATPKLPQGAILEDRWPTARDAQPPAPVPGGGYMYDPKLRAYIPVGPDGKHVVPDGHQTGHAPVRSDLSGLSGGWDILGTGGGAPGSSTTGPFPVPPGMGQGSPRIATDDSILPPWLRPGAGAYPGSNVPGGVGIGSFATSIYSSMPPVNLPPHGGGAPPPGSFGLGSLPGLEWTTVPSPTRPGGPLEDWLGRRPPRPELPSWAQIGPGGTPPSSGPPAGMSDEEWRRLIATFGAPPGSERPWGRIHGGPIGFNGGGFATGDPFYQHNWPWDPGHDLEPPGYNKKLNPGGFPVPGGPSPGPSKVTPDPGTLPPSGWPRPGGTHPGRFFPPYMPPGWQFGQGGPETLTPRQGGGSIYGQVPGPGPFGRDSVHAMLEPGEFVVRRDVAQQNMDDLLQFNAGVKKFDTGGPAGGGSGLDPLLNALTGHAPPAPAPPKGLPGLLLPPEALPGATGSQQAKVDSDRQRLDEAQRHFDQHARGAYTGAPGGDQNALGSNLFTARQNLQQSSRILDDLRSSLGLAPGAPLPANIGTQSFAPDTRYSPRPGMWNQLSGALSRGSAGLLPDVATDVHTYGHWGQHSGADQASAILDTAGLIPIPGLGLVERGLATAGRGGLRALRGLRNPLERAAVESPRLGPSIAHPVLSSGFGSRIAEIWQLQATFPAAKAIMRRGAEEALRSGYKGLPGSPIRAGNWMHDFIERAQLHLDAHAAGIEPHALRPEDLSAQDVEALTALGREMGSHVAHSPLSEDPLFRGTQLSMEEMDQLLAAGPGHTFNWDRVKSFSPDSHSAFMYAIQNASWMNRPDAATESAIFEIMGGARAAGMNLLGMPEYITSGKFRLHSILDAVSGGKWEGFDTGSGPAREDGGGIIPKFVLEHLGFLLGGGVQAKKDGGFLEGHVPYLGPIGRDSVHAVLEPGEFVVKREIAQKYMNDLWLLNAGAKGFQPGGQVGAPGAPGQPGMPQLNTEGAQIDTIAIAETIAQLFGITDIGMYRGDRLPEHPSGEAADVMVGTDNPIGNQVNQFALGNAGAFDVLYTIWQNKMWYPDGHSEDYGADPSDVTNSHRNHVHIRTAGGGYPGGNKPAGAPSPAGTKGTPAPAASGAGSVMLSGAGVMPGAGGNADQAAGSQYLSSLGLPTSTGATNPLNNSTTGGWVTSPTSGRQVFLGPHEYAEWNQRQRERQSSITEAQTGIGEAQRTITEDTKKQSEALNEYNEKLKEYNEYVKAMQEATHGAWKVGDPVPPGFEQTKYKQLTDAVNGAAGKYDTASRGLQTATDALGKKTESYRDLMSKPPDEPKGEPIKPEKAAQEFGKGLIGGLLQGLGLDNSVFSNPLDWGIYKMFTGVANYGMGKLNQMEEHGSPLFGTAAGGPGGPIASTPGSGITGALNSIFPGIDRLIQPTVANLPGQMSAPAQQPDGMGGIPGAPQQTINISGVPIDPAINAINDSNLAGSRGNVYSTNPSAIPGGP